MKRFLMFFASSLLISATALAADENVNVDSAIDKPTETTTVTKSTSEGEEPSTLEKLLSKMPKLSGYLQTGWNYTTQGKGTSSFQAKRLRLIMDGQVMKNVTFRLQIEAFNGIGGSRNGNGQKNLQVMDAFATAKISDALNIRVGQYYLPLGFENFNSSPSVLETVDFSNICYRMVCRNPISYNVVDYGRDLGVMVFGNVLPNAEKEFNYLSYYLSLTNGNMPMKDDNNKSKDIIAALEFHPIKNLMIKGAYNWGEYAAENISGGNSLAPVGVKHQEMNRYIFGAWYNDPNGLNVRTEYGHIQAGSYVKEDGFYTLVAYTIGNWVPVVRYDMYRDKINKSTLNNYDRILGGFTYMISKKLKIQANYGYTMYTKEAKDVSNDGKKGSSQIQIMAMYKF